MKRRRQTAESGRKKCRFLPQGMEIFRNLPIFHKLILLNFLLLSAFLAIGIAAVQITSRIYDQQLYIRTMQVMGQVSDAIDTELKAIESFSLNVALDPDIQAQLPSMQNTSDSLEQIIWTNKLKSKLLVESMTESALASVSYVDKSGKIFNVGENLVDLESSDAADLIRRAVAANGSYVTQAPTPPSVYFQSAREIVQYEDLSLVPMGTLLFGCNLDTIVRANAKALNGDRTMLQIYADGKVIYASNPAVRKQTVPQSSKQGYQLRNIGGRQYFLVYVHSDYLQWTYVTLLPYQDIFQQDIILRYILLAAFMGLFVCSVFVNFRVARHITRPIEDLTASMKQVENGDFEGKTFQLADYGRPDEVGVLQKDFLMMIRRIDELIHENYEKQLVIKDTEYRVLQAQIEPHFLYNTLSSINWLAKMGRDADVSVLTFSLSQLLRASISTKSVIFLEEEVRLLTCYINIQKIRYADRAEFAVDIAREHLPCMVPRMILQPLVENAIKYGVENMLDVCRIRVTSQARGDDLQILVRDTGPGIEPGELEKINRMDFVPKGTGIGLKNINDRLKLLFGEAYGLHVESRPGEGTEVTVIVPRRYQ